MRNIIIYLLLIIISLISIGYAITVKNSDNSINLFYSDPAKSITVSSNGNVGIATNNYDEILNINGIVKADKLIGDGTGLTSIVGTGRWDHMATQNIIISSNWIAFDSVRQGIRLDPSGNVSIGVSIDILSSEYKLNVLGTINATFFNGTINYVITADLPANMDTFQFVSFAYYVITADNADLFFGHTVSQCLAVSDWAVSCNMALTANAMDYNNVYNTLNRTITGDYIVGRALIVSYSYNSYIERIVGAKDVYMFKVYDELVNPPTTNISGKMRIANDGTVTTVNAYVRKAAGAQTNVQFSLVESNYSGTLQNIVVTINPTPVVDVNGSLIMPISPISHSGVSANNFFWLDYTAGSSSADIIITIEVAKPTRDIGT